MARSTFVSQNTSLSEPFLKLRSGKMARRCGAKHIFKSKCTKHCMLGPILLLQMSKNGTRPWREAHLQVKICKKPQCGTNFGRSNVQKSHAAVARSAFASENVKKLTGTDDFLNCRCRKIARRCGAKHICKSKCAKHLRFAAF